MVDRYYIPGTYIGVGVFFFQGGHGGENSLLTELTTNIERFTDTYGMVDRYVYSRWRVFEVTDAAVLPYCCTVRPGTFPGEADSSRVMV